MKIQQNKCQNDLTGDLDGHNQIFVSTFFGIQARCHEMPLKKHCAGPRAPVCFLCLGHHRVTHSGHARQIKRRTPLVMRSLAQPQQQVTKSNQMQSGQ